MPFTLPKAIQDIRTRLITAYGDKEGQELFFLLLNKSNNSVSTLQDFFLSFDQHPRQYPVQFLKTGFSTFFSSALFTDYFFKDASYIPLLRPFVSSFLSLSWSYAEPIHYPRFPMKMLFESNRINLAHLDRAVTNGLTVYYPEKRIGSTPGIFLILIHGLLQEHTSMDNVRCTLYFFVTQLECTTEEKKYYPLLLKIILLLARERNIQLSAAVAVCNEILEKKKVSSKELIFIIYDFYIDNRYSERHLLTLFSLIRTCIRSFYPGRKELIPSILNLLKDFIRISHSCTSKYLKTIFAQYVQHPHLDLSDWVEEGARIIREHGDDSKSAHAYFEKESDLSQRIWKEIDSGIYFDQVYQRMQFFVNAITEGTIQLKNADHFPIRENEFLYYTDGRNIFIPSYVNYVKDREKNYTVLLHSIAHECAHIEFGSFLKSKKRYITVAAEMEKLFPGQFRKNQLTIEQHLERIKQELEERGYPVSSVRVDTDTAPHLTRLLFHAEFPLLLSDVWNIIEDFRVNRLLYDKYTGFRKERGIVDDIDFENAPALETLEHVDNLINSFLQTVWFGKRRGEPHREVYPYFVMIMDCFKEFQSLSSPDTYDSMRYAGRAYKIILHYLQSKKPQLLQSIRKQADPLRMDFRILGITTQERNASLQIEVEAIKSHMNTMRDGEEDIEKIIEQKNARERFQSAVKKYADIHTIKELDNQTNVHLYPEWDSEKNCYINDRCLLSELPLLPSDKRTRDTLNQRYSGYLESVKRAFLKMRPEHLVQHRGMDDGHEIDFDRYVDALMDFSSGNQMENNYYIFRERKVRSVLSGLVLDMSPSTDEVIEGGTIFLYQKYATYLLSEAMSIIGDPFGIFSFYDYGPSATFFYTLKDFVEPYASFHYKRLCSFQPSARGFSRLSVGLRHIIGKMKEYDAKSKIIFFITDGFPCYFEDAIDRGETATVFFVDGTRRVEVEHPVPVVDAVYKKNQYVLHDLQKVREEAALAGIKLFCITLDADSITFMEDVFGHALIYLPDISELPKRLLEIFRKATS